MSNLNTDSNNKKKGLGRGLGSLLGGPQTETNEAPAGASSTLNFKMSAQSVSGANMTSQMTSQPKVEVVDNKDKVWTVAIDKLKPGKYQPRKAFEKTSLEELAQSIKSNGILQPIIVRKLENGSLEIIAGERRWRAAQLASLHDVPVVIKDFNDNQALELSIIENIQREDLNAIEEAEGYFRLSTEFSMSHQQIAEKVGKDRATVSNSIRILSLPKEVKEFILSKELSLGHAKVLLALENKESIVEAAKKTVALKLSVRKLEKLVSDILEGKNKNSKEPETNTVLLAVIKDLENKIQNKFGTKVNIDYSNGKGKITLNFYSKDEFDNIIEKINAGN